MEEEREETEEPKVREDQDKACTVVTPQHLWLPGDPQKAKQGVEELVRPQPIAEEPLVLPGKGEVRFFFSIIETFFSYDLF